MARRNHRCAYCGTRLARAGKCETCKALSRHLSDIHADPITRMGPVNAAIIEARVAVYAARAAAGLPLFGG